MTKTLHSEQGSILASSLRLRYVARSFPHLSQSDRNESFLGRAWSIVNHHTREWGGHKGSKKEKNALLTLFPFPFPFSLAAQQKV